MNDNSDASARLRPYVFAALLIFAFLYNYPCGLRSFDAENISIAMDGPYRILIGQVPFRDFYLPFSPILFWMQALMFRITGINYLSLVTLGSFMNVVGTGCVLATGWWLFRRTWLTAAAGLITTLWYLPIEQGIAWYSTAGLLFLYIALALLHGPFHKSGPAACFFAGLCVAVSFYCKQPMGAAGGLFFALHLVTTGRYRDAAWFCVGAAASLGLLTGFWTWMGGWENFLRYNFILPLRFRHSLNPLSPPLLIFFAPLLGLFFMENRRDRSLLFCLAMIQYASGLFTHAGIYQYWPFLGLQFALVGRGLQAWGASRARDMEQRIGISVNLSWIVRGGFVFIILIGLRFSLLRKLSGAWLQVSFIGVAAALVGLIWGAWLLLAAALRRHKPVARSLLWGSVPGFILFGLGVHHAARIYEKKLSEPPEVLAAARGSGSRLPGLERALLPAREAAALERAAQYLQNLPSERRPFFIFPLYTLLYPLLGQPPPQPFLWFWVPVTFSGRSDEDKLCGALKKSGVRTVVLTGNGQGNNLDIAPCLKRWLESDFQLDRKMDFFDFYEMRDGRLGQALAAPIRQELPKE